MTETGLFLGKFAPLHRGHQYVIERARERVDQLLVLVYDVPETTATPLSVRADWLRSLYPGVEVLEGWTLPTDVGYDEETKRRQERAVLDKLDGRTVDVFVSSEPYGDHMSRALGAEDFRVDPDRETVPISATAIRNDLYAHREYVADPVYRDLITDVVFLGGPSTGKTTITRELADRFDTEWMAEYGREYWEEHNVDRRLTKAQLVEIAAGHRAREDDALTSANKYLFTDTNAITTYVFSQYYHGEAHPRLGELAEDCAFRYDLTFVCGADIPYDDTPDRSGEGNRTRLQKMTLAYLDSHNIPYVVLTGSLETRIETVCAVLDSFEKYDRERPAFGSTRST